MQARVHRWERIPITVQSVEPRRAQVSRQSEPELGRAFRVATEERLSVSAGAILPITISQNGVENVTGRYSILKTAACRWWL